MARLDTKLESAGAEFLVLGNLLIQGTSAYKTYQNFPGYDVVAVSSDKNKVAKIQVKSRYQTGWNGFIINNFDCDFVVLVALNRGYKKSQKSGESGIKNPDYYIFPIKYIHQLRDNKNNWGKINKSRMIGYLDYKDNWNLIEDFLKT